jgi:glycosyltransferase involved in cell wall biosynthesis
VDNQGIRKDELKYLHEEQPRQLEGNRQYILFLARNVLKKHNVFFPFQDCKVDIVHVFDGFSKPLFFKKNLPTVYSVLQPPINKTKSIKQFHFLFSERAGFDMFKLGFLGMVPQKWFCRYFKKFNQILTVSEYEKNFLVKNGVSENKITKLGIGVDYTFFKPKKIERNEDVFVISYFGAVSAFKGIDIVYKVAKLFRGNEKIKFKLALDLYPKRHSTILEKMKKFENVEIFGHVPDLRNFLNTSDLIFLPFTTMLGNFSIPLVLLEAMSTGNIVLTTNLPPLMEVIENNKNGFICSINEMKDNIDWIYKNKDSLDYVKKNARDFIIENCDWGKITEKMFSIYNQVINV